LKTGEWLRCSHEILALEMAKAGLGLALVRDFPAARHIGKGALAYSDNNRVSARRSYRLCYKSMRASDGATTCFNVTPPGGDGSAMFDGSVSGNSISDTLPRDGTSLVTVCQIGAAADSGTATAFTLDIAITGGASASSGASSLRGGRVTGGCATVAVLAAGDRLNVRSGPSTKSAVVTEPGDGRLVQILQCQQSGGQEWCEIAAHSDSGQPRRAAGRCLKSK
jgi:hypothetical protein